ncbi:MAG: hypothetical protein R6W77_09290 [Trueperaceae bacterium]
MPRDPWARLASPFSPDALAWRVAEVDEGGALARLAPVVGAAAVVARLDEVVGAAGWSFHLAPMGPDVLVGNLMVQGVTRVSLVRVDHREGADPSRHADEALSTAALGFGMRPPIDAEAAYWVDYDPDAGEPLHLPDIEASIRAGLRAGMRAGSDSGSDSGSDFGSDAGSDSGIGADVRADGRTEAPAEHSDTATAAASAAATAAATAAASAAASAAAPAAAPAGAHAEAPAEDPAGADARPEARTDTRSAGAHEVIERLIERLREEGLGKEAALLVVRYQGYGRTPEESRELYGRLRSLLLEKGATVP